MRKLKDDGLFQMLHDYLNIYLPDQKHMSTNTIKSYRESINLLLDYATKVKGIRLHDMSFSKIDSILIFEFLNWLETERACSVSTRNQRLSCIRSFYKYSSVMDYALMAHRNEILKVPLKKDEANKAVIKYMTENAVQAILRQPDVHTSKGIRDQFFMILMYDAGARDREILDLHLKDFEADSKNPCIHVTGKGNKKRIIPVMAKTVEHFKQYIQIYHSDHDSDRYLFYTVRHGTIQPMSDDNVARFMNSHRRKASYECQEVPMCINPHMWRHSRAIHLYRAGMPLPLLSEWLGHAQLETTQIYAYADIEMKRTAINKATGAANPLKGPVMASWKQEDSDDLIRKLYGIR